MTNGCKSFSCYLQLKSVTYNWSMYKCLREKDRGAGPQCLRGGGPGGSLPSVQVPPGTVLSTVQYSTVQYKSLQTVLRGSGLLSGDWRREHRRNNINVYMIEPLCESLLQVHTSCSGSVTLSHCHSVTLSLCLPVTLSLCHSVTLSLCH